MARGFFVTGTDTGVGKTLVATALLRALAGRGIVAAGMKPVACGAVQTAGGLRNDDALALMQESGVTLPYPVVNPYCFEPAVAPHIAATEAGVEIDLGNILMNYLHVAAAARVTVVEGAGGWLVPLNSQVTSAAVPSILSLDVIMVVGLRLGCLSHALLTAESIERHGCRPVAWVGNVVDPAMARLDQNITALRERLPVPCLGIVPHLSQPTAAAAASRLDLALLGIPG
jgi:dethiobiotin synthetase